METVKSWWDGNKTQVGKVMTPIAAVTGIVGAYVAGRYIFDQLSRKYHNYPPGPSGYPVVGSGMRFGNDPRTFLKDLYKNDKYVSMFYVMVEPWIIVHDLSIVKKYFNKPEFGDRSELPTIWVLHSILNTNYKDSQPRRQVMIQALISQAQRSKRLYQLIGKSIEIDMFNEINNCIKNKCKWDIRKEAQFVTFSTIYTSTIGESIDVKDKTFEKFVQATQEFFAASAPATVLHSIIPEWLISRGKGLPVIATFREAQNKLIDIVKIWALDKINNINKEIENGTIDINNDSNNHSKDDYIRELVILSKKENIDVHSMLSDIVLAFLAGTHTTATSIEQGVLYLAQNPQMQERIYIELVEHKLDLKENYGNLKLLQKCCIFKAFIYEILRFNGIVFTNGMRSATRRMEIKYFDKESQTEKSYNVPSNAIIVVNLWHLMTKSEEFGNDGLKFDIKNWLTQDNKFNDSKYLPAFGHGNRNCAGQILARNELYLVLGLLILHYKFKPPNGIKPQNFKIPLAFEKANKPLGVECEKRSALP